MLPEVMQVASKFVEGGIGEVGTMCTTCQVTLIKTTFKKNNFLH